MVGLFGKWHGKCSRLGQGGRVDFGGGLDFFLLPCYLLLTTGLVFVLSEGKAKMFDMSGRWWLPAAGAYILIERIID
jgi:hypothetical protein